MEEELNLSIVRKELVPFTPSKMLLRENTYVKLAI